MATDTENKGTANVSDWFSIDKISEGFKLAWQSINNSNAEQEQLLKQHMANGGQTDVANDPLLDVLSKNNERLGLLYESEQRVADMFAQFAQSMSIGSVGGQSSLSAAVENQGSAIVGTASKEFDSSAVGAIKAAYSGMGGSTSATMQTAPTVPVDNSSLFQSVMNAMSDGSRNSVENDQKLITAEEDRQYKSVATPTMKKLEQAIDQYLSDGIKVDVSGSSDGGSGFGSLIAAALGALSAGIVGFATGYLAKFGEMWKTIGKSFKNVFSDIGAWAKKTGASIKNWLKDTSVGKKLAQWKGDFLAKITEIKSGFMNMLSGWKKAFSESMVGKGLAKAGEMAKSAGSFIKNMASKVVGKVKGAAETVKNGGIMKAIAKGASMLANGPLKKLASAAKSVVTKGPIGAAVNAAKKVFPMAMKVAKKIPVVQAAGGVLDTAVNTYKVAKAGGSITDIMNTAAAGGIDALSDVLMVPELVNAVKGAKEARKNGEGILAGFGKGFIKQRNANDISYGQGLISNIQHFTGNETETSKRIRESFNAGNGYKEAGLSTVTGAAAGFGHSAALYKPTAPGSLANSREPNATVVDNMPTTAATEADRMKALTDAVETGVKNATLSPEVREVNVQNAKATGDAINGQLFGS